MRVPTLVLASVLAAPGANASLLSVQSAQPSTGSAHRETTFRLDNGVLIPADPDGSSETIPRSRIEIPKLTHSVGPQFPAENNLTGTSLLSAVIGLDGNPSQIRVVHSLRPDYDRKAMEAVSHYRFKPATLDGKPTPMRINVEIYFGR